MASKHIKTGEIGEKTALNHLERQGFLHIESNFKARTGEIDLILEKDGTIHFVEVKTVSREIYGVSSRNSVSHGTYRHEENVHREKLRKILNTIQVWLSLNKYEGPWQLDIAAITIDSESRRGRICMIENVIVE
jgi:putative endonuclease